MNIEQQVEAGVSSAFDKIKNIFTPKASAELDKALKDLEAANGKVADLEGKLQVALQDVTDREGKITQLQGELDTTKKSVSAQANQKALVIEQERGATAPVKEEENPGNSAKSMVEQYRELQASDPRAAAKFFAEHRDEILK